MRWDEHVKASITAIRSIAALETEVEYASRLLVASALRYVPILTCGNGGSAADSMHFAAELVGRFRRGRRAVPCVALAADPAILTAWSNDTAFEDVFRRQVEALGRPYGTLLAFTTSGRSKNVIAAVEAALAMNMHVVALTGRRGLDGVAPTVLISVDSTDSALVQQAHQVIYHHLAARIDEAVSP